MSTRWPGGIISGTPPVPTGGGAGDSASGIWTIEQADQYIATGEWPGTGIPDPQFQYVTALLHGDGTNGGQNNTFLDSSSNNFTITRNGNATQGSFSPYGDLWSNFFSNTSGMSLAFPSNAAFAFGTGDFTVEGWIMGFGLSGAEKGIWGIGPTGGVADNTTVRVNAGRFTFWCGGSGNNVNTNTVLSDGVWYHFALVRQSGTFRFYINGNLDTTSTTGGSYNQGQQSGKIGQNYNDQNIETFNGYISNLRVVKGTAVYPNGTAFTPSTTPLTAIANTSLLACQSNRFRDNSSNNFTLTVNGTPSVQRFSPFQNLATYTTARVGGSGYFDGSGDYLTLPSSASLATGTGDFTIECWVYFNNTNNQYVFSGSGATIQISGGSLVSYDGSTNRTIGTPVANQWLHIAICRSGTTIRTFLNGVQGTSFTSSGTQYTHSSGVIGAEFGTGNTGLNGYIGNYRFVVGTALYTSAFTPNTAPLTNITNTALLLNFTNAAIFDSDASNDFETVGNAQISTSVVKYGTGSMYFDGTGDSLNTPNNLPIHALGSGNFTIEGWYYSLDSGSSQRCMFDSRANAASNSGLFIRENSGGFVIGKGSAGLITTTSGRTANAWQHVAVVRVGGVISLYLNGNLSASVSETQNFSDTYLRISGFVDTQASPFAYNGYMDDVRITVGYARYWYPFQPPTRAFPNYGGTLPAPTEDELFEYTTLLLNGDGANGGQNNTFVDSSTNNFTITRNGNTTQGSFSPYGTLWSNFFNGSSAFTLAQNAAFAFGTGDFAIEAWVYNTSRPNDSILIDTRSQNVLQAYAFIIDGAGKLDFIYSSNRVTSATSVPLNQWAHVAVTRSSGTIRFFINGVLDANTASFSSTLNATSFPSIGGGRSTSSNAVTGYYFNGYLSNFRIVKGSAVYISSFSPSTTPLTAVSGTSLLICQSNRFVDNSSNAFALSLVGAPSVQRFSPFEPSAPYSTSVIGGSGYFDGSGDYLLAATGSSGAPGTGDFCVEAFYYRASGASDNNIITNIINSGDGDAAWGIAAGSTVANNLTFSSWNTTFFSVTAPPLNTWNHVAVCRSGTTLSMFLNGTRVATATNSTNFSSTNDIRIGAYASGFQPFNGYISNARVVKGSSVYNPASTTITVPTAPLTAITNTQLLTNFTNAAIPDRAMQNNLETVGNAQISTSVVKYGSGSLYFDGTGDWLSAQGFKAALADLPGDFTVEAWIYLTATGSFQGIVAFTDSTGWNGWQFAIGSSQSIYFEFLNNSGAAAGAYSSNGAISVNTWTHVAAARVGSTITVYVNGNPVATTTYSSFTSGANSYVGVGTDRTKNTNWFNGYIDDLRITRGVSRYAQPFTPPTAALPTY